ncbi:sulfatase-like hydrolase/transferase [Saccharicrinis sp. FJH62]|uniref:sulfatase-like hydrolase/transferase n=1 Tax=Saccharicrinis sp. FJH62 TaxID=3344657 RepID=UPI0035D43F20
MKKTLALMGLAGSLAVQAQTQKPNIMIIMADDMGYSDLGCYGGEIQTPNIDSLAASGIRFTQMYNCARCCPTRGSLLTGQYPQNIGITGMGVNLDMNAATIAEVLRDNGYHTGMTGKWHLSETKALSSSSEHLKWLAHQVDYSPFAPVETYPSNRGFEEHYGVIWGVVDYYDPFSLVHNTDPIDTVPDDFYMTDFVTEKTLDLLDEFSQDDKPFFMYVAHTAPHWPLHALPEDIAKYKDTYKDGWDVMRQNRYNRMIELGIIDGDNCTLPANSSGRDWATADQTYESNCMSVHAAMVDHVDQSVGTIIQKLKDMGEYDNTIIFVLSDNGASYERGYPPGFDRPGFTRDGTTIEYNSQNPGPETTWNYIGQAWASASNTPFRYWKMESYAGGTATPFIVHWPDGMEGKENTFNRGVGHVIDVMPTCLELAGATYPDEINGLKTNELDGKSLIPLLSGETESIHDTLYWEHQGGKAVRIGDWKLVSLPNSSWELFNLATDASENHDLSAEYPGKVFEMSEVWDAWAVKVGLKQPVVEVPTELIFHYGFDGNLDDSSPNKYVLTSHSGQNFAAGKHGEALELNGINQYLDLNQTNLVNPATTQFTACAWVYNVSPTVPASGSFYEEVILAHKDGPTDAAGRIYMYYRMDPDGGMFNNFLGANLNFSSKGSFVRGEWIHVAVVCDPQSQTVKYYINGEKNTICYTPAFESCTGGYRIGAHKTGDKNFWNGKIDELYLFKGMLDQAEIQDVMNDNWNHADAVNELQPELFRINPNPVHGFLNVEGVICIKMELLDISGKVIKKVFETNEMRTDDLVSGQYIVKITTQEGLTGNRKILIQ